MKTQSKLPESDGKVLDKVPQRSLEGFFLQAWPSKTLGNDILLNMTDVPMHILHIHIFKAKILQILILLIFF